jgi:hypothetical protein
VLPKPFFFKISQLINYFFLGKKEAQKLGLGSSELFKKAAQSKQLPNWRKFANHPVAKEKQRRNKIDSKNA